MISEDLMLNNKEISARILPFGGSDHWSIYLEVQSIGTPRNRPFRFQNIWLSLIQISIVILLNGGQKI